MSSAKYISDRIRLLIATKQFQVDELLPSTRELGKQLKVSFHTVRKAYQLLEQEGLVKAQVGKGFIVKKQTSLIDKENRLEVGAQKMKDLLEELVGFGLSEDEVETIFDEQLTYMEWPQRYESCASVGFNEEHASMISGSIQRAIGVKSDAIAYNDPNVLVNYDALFVPVQYLKDFRVEYDDMKIIPVVYQWDPEFLIRLSEKESILNFGLVTKDEKTIAFILDELRAHFKHITLVAGAIYGKSLPLFVRDVDIVLYPPDSATLVERQLPEKKRSKLTYSIAEISLNAIRSELWDQ